MSWTVLVAESLEERDRELCRRLESAWNPKTGQLEAQLLVPTLQRTAYLQARIVEHFEGRCWLPRVETLEQFLRRQSQSLEEPAPWISDEMRILMIQALLPETEYGKRRSPGRGTARRFLEVIEALSGVWREDRDLDPLAQKLLGDPHAYGHTVVELARRYERRLRERNVRDWRLVALDLIEAWRRQAGSPLGRTLVVDSFSRLRPIEADLLDALAARFLEVIVTLSGSDSDLDKELNRRGLLVQRSVWSWAKRHRPRVVFCRPSEDDGSRSAGLRQVARRLFEPVAALLEAPPLALPPGGLRLLRPATRREEVRRVAREIRDSARSLPALDLQGIALVVPSVQAYRELIQEVFQEYGVPVVFFQGVPLASHPEVRRALKLLRLLAREEGRLDRRDDRRPDPRGPT
ncbi:MAG: hypothetical protein KatS3mg115_1239 [Candidatus Poribacteria bacterium]|nr:MAG: hypothetical protein KatS3mg115_1239 [Candidatus Poribacteria bacterium]